MDYLVLECKKSYCVVLDEEGRFLHVLNKGYEVGDTLCEITLIKEPKKKREVSTKMIVLIGSTAAGFLFLFTLLWNVLQLRPYAAVYLSINPALKIEVTKEEKVVSLTAENEDGKTLLSGYDDYKGKALDTVTNELLDRAISLGFLAEGGRVSLNIDSPDEGWFQQKGSEIRQRVEKYLSERLTVTIEVGKFGEGAASSSSSVPSSSDGSPDSSSFYVPSSSAPGSSSQSGSSSTPSSQVITKEAALDIAIGHAGIDRAKIRSYQIKMDADDDEPEYEIKIYVGEYKHDFEIDARTGQVKDYDWNLEGQDDKDDDKDDD